MTQFRPGSLSGRQIRQTFASLNHPAVTWSARALDEMAELWDGLEAVRSNANPLNTAERRAADFLKHHEATTKRAREVVDRAVQSIAQLEQDTLSAARAKLGLDRVPPHAAEIRAALRAMPQAERDKAMSDALAAGDVELLTACMGSHSVLTGKFTVPLDTQLRALIETQCPEVAACREAVEQLGTALSIGYKSFEASANNMRDRGAESRAIEGAEAAAKAESQLAAAIRGASDAA